MVFGSFPVPHSMRYPGGRKVLKPWIRFGCPAKSSETRLMTPGVSILAKDLVRTEFETEQRLCVTYAWLLKSFMISRNRL